MRAQRSYVETQISKHRDTSPHGIALIGSPPSLEPDAQKLLGGGLLSDEHIWQPPNAQQYFGMPVYDPANIVRATLGG